MDSLLHLLFQIEAIDGALRRGEPDMPGGGPPADSMALGGFSGSAGGGEKAEIDLLLAELPKPLRDQYEWLRTWTAYPIARLRNRACTGCGGSYPLDHPFVAASETRITYCEHCLRILLLRDLALVA